MTLVSQSSGMCEPGKGPQVCLPSTHATPDCSLADPPSITSLHPYALLPQPSTNPPGHLSVLASAFFPHYSKF